jgi:hypothetical protein
LPEALGYATETRSCNFFVPYWHQGCCWNHGIFGLTLRLWGAFRYTKTDHPIPSCPLRGTHEITKMVSQSDQEIERVLRYYALLLCFTILNLGYIDPPYSCCWVPFLSNLNILANNVLRD